MKSIVALATHLRRHRGLQVGEETTEMVKTQFASTFLPEHLDKTLTVRGRDVQTGSPGAVEVTAGEIYPIVESIVRRVAQNRQRYSDRTATGSRGRHL